MQILLDLNNLSHQHQQTFINYCIVLIRRDILCIQLCVSNDSGLPSHNPYSNCNQSSCMCQKQSTNSSSPKWVVSNPMGTKNHGVFGWVFIQQSLVIANWEPWPPIQYLCSCQITQYSIYEGSNFWYTLTSLCPICNPTNIPSGAAKNEQFLILFRRDSTNIALIANQGRQCEQALQIACFIYRLFLDLITTQIFNWKNSIWRWYEAKTMVSCVVWVFDEVKPIVMVLGWCWNGNQTVMAGWNDC